MIAIFTYWKTRGDTKTTFWVSPLTTWSCVYNYVQLLLYIYAAPCGKGRDLLLCFFIGVFNVSEVSFNELVEYHQEWVQVNCLRHCSRWYCCSSVRSAMRSVGIVSNGSCREGGKIEPLRTESPLHQVHCTKPIPACLATEGNHPH